MVYITANDLRRMLLLQRKWDAVVLVKVSNVDDVVWAILSPLSAEVLASALRRIAEKIEKGDGSRE